MDTSSLYSPSVQVFKKTMSYWPTGIAVITTNYKQKLYGFIANSITSVSISPMLILFCISNKSRSLDAFLQNKKFGISFLSKDQKEFIRTYSTNQQRFKDKDSYILGHYTKSPLIANASCFLECLTYRIYNGGDHKIILGRVIFCQTNDKSPLIYINSAIFEK